MTAIDHVTINKKDYPLTFGMRFVQLIDEKYGVEVQHMNLGGGLEMVVARLSSPLVREGLFIDLIKAATDTLKQKPSNDDLEDWVFEQADTDGGIEQLSEDFLDAFEQSKWTKRIMKNLKDLSDQYEAQEGTTDLRTVDN